MRSNASATIEYDPRQLPSITYTRLNAALPAGGRARAADPSGDLARARARRSSVGRAFLIDMNRVFEDFVVVALREALRLSE